jgi:hypothetical protein
MATINLSQLSWGSATCLTSECICSNLPDAAEDDLVGYL